VLGLRDDKRRLVRLELHILEAHVDVEQQSQC
jgi:hypothetical protein